MIRRLSDIFPDAPDIEFNDVKTNSNDINPYDLFVCVRGINVDTHDFLAQASQAKAAGAIVSKEVSTDLPTYKVEHPERALLELVKKVYSFDDLNLIAITGAHGKTSMANMLGSFLNHHSSAGVIGSKGAFSPIIMIHLRVHPLKLKTYIACFTPFIPKEIGLLLLKQVMIVIIVDALKD
jgi:UDP-N-acetylmuramyl pentapeptide synthase